MPRVLMHFDRYRSLWWVGFMEADCKTPIGSPTRYYRFATLDGLRSFVVRCNPEDMDKFEDSVRAWRRGTNYVNITDEQYAKLKRGRDGPSV
jgi:hypothetical protein